MAGYQHRKTKSDSSNATTYNQPGVQIDYAARWCFSVRPPSTPFVAPTWLNQELARTKPVCELCDVVFTTDIDLNNHLAGSKHSQRVKKLKRLRRLEAIKERKQGPKTEPVRCGPCKLTCTSLRDFENHCKGKRHQSNIHAIKSNSNC